MPSVTKIITEYLEQKGYDGLYSPYQCGCLKKDLAPCGEICGNCVAGFAHYHSVSGDFVVTDSAAPMSDDDIDHILKTCS